VPSIVTPAAAAAADMGLDAEIDAWYEATHVQVLQDRSTPVEVWFYLIRF
jgi:hypothetical protein